MNRTKVYCQGRSDELDKTIEKVDWKNKSHGASAADKWSKLSINSCKTNIVIYGSGLPGLDSLTLRNEANFYK